MRALAMEAHDCEDLHAPMRGYSLSVASVLDLPGSEPAQTLRAQPPASARIPT